MKIVFVHGREPFTPIDEAVSKAIEELRTAGNEVDYVWLPKGTTAEERADAVIAAALMYIEGTDQIVVHGFPTGYITPLLQDSPDRLVRFEPAEHYQSQSDTLGPLERAAQ